VYAVTGPLSILAISALFLGERINLQKGFGIGVALVGVLLVMGPERLAAFDYRGYLFGDLFVILSIVLWGVFTVYGKKITRQIGALNLTAIVTVIGALTMLPVGFGEMSANGISLAEIPLRAWMAIGFLGLTCSFLATLLYFMALHRTESQKVGVFLYTIPPMTYLFSALVLGETASLYLLLGSGLVLGGVYLTERG
jgi:drug/metabolite transporter (DMT)-like permease